MSQKSNGELPNGFARGNPYRYIDFFSKCDEGLSAAEKLEVIRDKDRADWLAALNDIAEPLDYLLSQARDVIAELKNLCLDRNFTLSDSNREACESTSSDKERLLANLKAISQRRVNGLRTLRQVLSLCPHVVDKVFIQETWVPDLAQDAQDKADHTPTAQELRKEGKSISHN